MKEAELFIPHITSAYFIFPSLTIHIFLSTERIPGLFSHFLAVKISL